MYNSFYGLRESPFELTSDPRFLWLTPRHREALSNLEYGLSTAKAVTVLTGDAGTGKTTLLKAALQSDACRGVRAVYLNNPTLTRSEFVEILAQRLNLSGEASRSKAALLQELEHVLLERRTRGVITALVVDEAQSLTTDILEEIRLLANIETAAHKLLPLVLVGQPELAERLEHASLRQLKQRVALRCQITPFSLQETAAYVGSRIKTAGGQAATLFTREAVMLIQEHSGGIPRLINVICDNALVSGMALGRRPVDREIVVEVCRDFWLRGNSEGQPPGDIATGVHDEPAASVEHVPTEPAASESNPEPPRRRFTILGAGTR
jgi:type II secretory pathway predicted ATPase ExeA